MSVSGSTKTVVRSLIGAALASLAAMALLSASAAPAQAATPGCSLSPTAGTVTMNIADRTYRLNVPSGLTGTQVPLLLSLHGAGSTGDQDAMFTGWTGYAAAHNFIVAYPQARGFGSYSGLWDPYETTSPDVPYLRSVVADISSRWCVDPKRVYADGWSNGAVMSQRAACDAADLFATVSSYGGGSPVSAGVAKPCAPSRPISVALTVGQEDFTYAGLSQNADEWRAIDGCGAAVHSTDQYGATDTYGCSAGTQLVTRVLNLTSHNWPSGAQGEDQRNRLWAFFTANSLP